MGKQRKLEKKAQLESLASSLGIINPESGGSCKNCGASDVKAKKLRGVAVYGWCTCLLLTTVLCFWVPCAIEECYDVKVYCTKCKMIRQ